MFQSAAIPQSLSKEAFDALVPKLRTDLLKAQLALAENKAFSVIVVITGVDGAGKNHAISRLYEWMDPRHLACNAYDDPTEDERLRPPFWRYWRDLPTKGEVSIVVSSWYHAPMRDRVLKRIGDGAFERQLAAINRFEEMLHADGVLILKFWFSLPFEEQKQRMEKLVKRRQKQRHILTEWADVRHSRRAQLAMETVALHTSTPEAPWYVIPSLDPEYRDHAFGQILASSIAKRLAQPQPAAAAAPAVVAGVEHRSAIDALDLSRSLDEKTYEHELAQSQAELAELTDRKGFADIALVAAFEGNDAAGKGGAIRRVAQTLDPRTYRVHRISAPSEEEKARPYLWRFWKRVPRRGHIAIFDRSWYGRVLVERVEGFCSEADWLRAYNEINAFEAELTDSGIVVAKFWLTISEAEQLERFKARQETAYKQFKITDEDWRNRLKWGAYAEAAGVMIDRTSTRYAPWTLIPAEDKRYARIAVLKTLCQQLRMAL